MLSHHYPCHDTYTCARPSTTSINVVINLEQAHDDDLCHPGKFNLYVQANGTLGASAVYQDSSTWGHEEKLSPDLPQIPHTSLASSKKRIVKSPRPPRPQPSTRSQKSHHLNELTSSFFVLCRSGCEWKSSGTLLPFRYTMERRHDMFRRTLTQSHARTANSATWERFKFQIS